MNEAEQIEHLYRCLTHVAERHDEALLVLLSKESYDELDREYAAFGPQGALDFHGSVNVFGVPVSWSRHLKGLNVRVITKRELEGGAAGKLDSEETL